MSRSKLEEALAFQIKALRLPEPEREVSLIEGRRFRCDFVWREAHLIVEVEGGYFMPKGSRHTRGAGFEDDMEKYNLLTLAGWRILRFGNKDIYAGTALRFIETALATCPKEPE